MTSIEWISAITGGVALGCVYVANDKLRLHLEGQLRMNDNLKKAIAMVAEEIDTVRTQSDNRGKFAIKATPYRPVETPEPTYPAPDDFSQIDAARNSSANVPAAPPSISPEIPQERPVQTEAVIDFVEPLHRPSYQAEGKF